mmetsp:Transcript_14472/g.30468  ORF Transcript_14472/g.30468 Transcript_14472/m.30468 type:complete len:461 (+) Transcript_14472:422-1804(+)
MTNSYYSQFHEGRIGGDIIGNLTRGCVIDRLKTMRHQEKTRYSYRNYDPRQNPSSSASSSIPSPPHLPQSAPPTGPTLNSTWREKICHWSFNVIDHFDLSREVVAISLSLFDRYLATLRNRCNGSTALLASLTTLHIAIKVHEVRKVKLTTLANLSRGQFGARHIEEMEWKVLTALQWHIHPPTAMAFLSHLLLLLPPQVNDASKEEIYALSRYITELSVCDANFVEVSPSAVAFSAVLNTLEDRRYRRLISNSMRDQYLRAIAMHVGLRVEDAEVVGARPKLKRLLASSLGSVDGSLGGDGGGGAVAMSAAMAQQQQQQQGTQQQQQQHRQQQQMQQPQQQQQQQQQLQQQLPQQESKADDSSLSSRQSRMSRRSRSSSYDSINTRRRAAVSVSTFSAMAQSSPVPNNINSNNNGNNGNHQRSRANPSPGRMSTSPCSMSSKSTSSRFNRLSPMTLLEA